ncbi:MAG: hypothetical protein M3Y46_11260 [Actinomycetota bacterium]|nr:hypothetical protein [Actinomycetota bacterium]
MDAATHEHTHHHQLHLDRAERKAQTLFAATALVAAIVVGAMLVSGWSGGVLRNDIEVLFWAGAILGAIGIGLLGLATLPTYRVGIITGLTRVGVVLFLVAPVLCVTAVFADFWM